MDWLLEQLAKEWAVIKQAPISFIVTCVLCLLITFLAVRWMYQERLAAKDDLLGYYREKLGFQPGEKTHYSGLRNSDLKNEALSFVSKLRTFAKEENQAMSSLAMRDWGNPLGGKTEEERVREWQRKADVFTSRSQQTMETYQREYKIDAILLRDELLGRLPLEQRATLKNKREMMRFELPINTNGIEYVADLLETMAKLL